MTELETARTLVKSTPELWAACSDADTLGKHLQAFGEIRITRLEPETTVAWEGESASGTVVLEPSGWGTKVTLTAAGTAVPDPTAAAIAEPVAEVEPVVAEPAVALEPGVARESAPVVVVKVRAGGLFGWMRSLLGQSEPVVATPVPVAKPEPVAVASEPIVAPEPAVSDALAGLEAALDSLGQAHHRPFSRD